jgi:hypothetical protein
MISSQGSSVSRVEDLDLGDRLNKRFYNTFIAKNYLLLDDSLTTFIWHLISDVLEIYHKNGNKLHPAYEQAMANICDPIDHKLFRGWATKAKLHLTVKADERNQATMKSTKNPEDGRYVRSYITDAFGYACSCEHHGLRDDMS